MASVRVIDDRLVVRLRPLEKLMALRGDLSIPLGEVRRARAVPDGFAELRGLRAPGTGLPGRLAFGTWRRRGAKDFVALRGRRPAVVLEFDAGSRYSRVLLTVDDGDALVRTLTTT